MCLALLTEAIIILAAMYRAMSALGMMIVAGSLLLPVLFKKMVRPLREIEKTTHRIAEGDFRPIAVPDTRDETQRVVEGFNG
jgi:nitrate/nitrite-specific signal transduction histidine kinase